jgi:Ran GTPase-activating protein (RanGAP) involved in mRNA processing and transport
LYRDVAQEVSQMALDKDANSMPWPHRLWCLMAFADSENEETVGQAALEILQLSLEAESSKQDRIRVVHRQMKERVAILRRFGRYPHFNDYLGRTSTDKELQWLRQKTVPGWALKATRVPEKSLVEIKTLPSKIPASLSESTSKLRVLVLHGNRQSAEGFRSKTEATFKPLVPLIDFVFLDGTFAHGSVHAEDGAASKQSKGRCWWDATDDPNDIRYVGLETTLEYIDQIFATQGPFHGILGFSQGACLAGLLASLQPQGHINFNFCILISGFYCRDVNHSNLQLAERPREPTLEHVKIIKEKVNMPSFHIWGESDEMVLPWRSQLLADHFNLAHSKRVSHPSDHFNRGRHQWPIHEVQQWLLCEVIPFQQPKPRTPKQLNSSEVELEKQIILISELLDRHPSLVDYSKEKTTGPNENDREFADEFGKIADALSKVSDAEKIIKWVQRLATSHVKGWSLLNMMDLHLSTLPTSSSCHIRSAIAETFARQLKQDYDAACEVQGLHGKLVHSLTSAPSLCVRQAPRFGSDFERRTRLSSRIARRLAAFEKPELADVDDEDLQRLRMLQPELSRKYRHFTSTILTALNIQSGHITKKDGIHLSSNDEFEVVLSAADFEKLRLTPISDAVLNPIPEPVEFATSDQLEPLFAFLESGQDLSVAKPLFDGPTSAGDIVFPKGTVTPDGRLDLCKQVIGPAGVDDLIHALDVDGALAVNPVQHLLLGNNKCEDGLPARIAKFLSSGKSKLTTWYIAGNHISGNGIQPLCEALKADQQVRQLWLKRNPLHAIGALHISNMLNQNLTLEVLDLLNCGLLDLGAKALARGVETSVSLRHLYLDGNGFTKEGSAVIAKAAATRVRTALKPLFTLSLGMNRLLDAGVEALVQELTTDLPASSMPVARLCLASCGLSPAAGLSLATLLGGPMHSLRYLDLGCSKATRALGEVPNRIGDEGAKSLAAALTKQGELSQKEEAVLLNGLVLTYNGIARVGLEALASALKQHSGLVVLNIEQTKADLRCEVAREQLRLKLAKNAQHLKSKCSEEQQLVQEALDPAHLEEIKSVYRIGNAYSPGGGVDIQ